MPHGTSGRYRKKGRSISNKTTLPMPVVHAADVVPRPPRDPWLLAEPEGARGMGPGGEPSAQEEPDLDEATTETQPEMLGSVGSEPPATPARVPARLTKAPVPPVRGTKTPPGWRNAVLVTGGAALAILALLVGFVHLQSPGVSPIHGHQGTGAVEQTGTTAGTPGARATPTARASGTPPVGTPTPTTGPPRPPSTEGRYVVRPGDDLVQIAAVYHLTSWVELYHTGTNQTTIDKLAAFYGHTEDPWDWIYPGEHLDVPK